MKITTVWVPEEYSDALDHLVTAGHFPTRSEAIRIAIRDLVISEFRVTRATQGEHIPQTAQPEGVTQ